MHLLQFVSQLLHEDVWASKKKPFEQTQVPSSLSSEFSEQLLHLFGPVSHVRQLIPHLTQESPSIYSSGPHLRQIEKPSL